MDYSFSDSGSISKRDDSTAWDTILSEFAQILDDILYIVSYSNERRKIKLDIWE